MYNEANVAAIGVEGNIHSGPPKAGGSTGGRGKGRKSFDFGEKARADVPNEGPFCDQAIFNNRCDTADNVANPSTQ